MNSHKVYDSQEVEEALKRPYSAISWYSHRSRRLNYRWLYWNRGPGLVLAVIMYGSKPMMQTLNPFGVWVKEGPGPLIPGTSIPITGFHEGRLESVHLPTIARNLHVKPSLLVGFVTHEKMAPYSRHRVTGIEQLRHQWSTFQGHTFEETSEKVRAEAPEQLHPLLFKRLKQEKYDAYIESQQFSWEKVYSHVLHEIALKLSQETKDKDCVDNVRVAKVGNRQHYHHYHRQKVRGCCGSHDVIVTLSDGQYYLGFNYGH